MCHRKNIYVKKVNKFFVMKRYILYIVCLLLYLPCTAQVKSYVSLWSEVAESSLMTKLDKSAISGGAGFGIGAGYEMSVNRFILSTGLQIDVSHTVFRVPDTESKLSGVYDDEGDLLNYVFLQTNRKDAYTNLSFQLPVMIGTHVNNFYFLAGAKLSISVLGRSNAKAQISSAGDYDKFIDDFTDMPEHLYYSGMPVTTKSSVSFRPDVMPSVELGYVFGEYSSEKGFDVPKYKNMYRIAVFADYGLLNRVSRGTKQSIVLPETFNTEDMSSGVKITDILSTNEITADVHGLTIGIKFTALIGLKEKKACVICR